LTGPPRGTASLYSILLSAKCNAFAFMNTTVTTKYPPPPLAFRLTFR